MYIKIINVCYWNAFSILIKQKFTLTHSNQQNQQQIIEENFMPIFLISCFFFIHNYSFSAESCCEKFYFFSVNNFVVVCLLFLWKFLLYFCYLFNCKIVGKVFIMLAMAQISCFMFYVFVLFDSGNLIYLFCYFGNESKKEWKEK